MPKCLQCQSERTVQGEIMNNQGRPIATFRPSSSRLFSFTLSHGPELISNACLDCGLVWNTVSTTELSAFVKKHCDP